MACNIACVATDYKTGARELLANNFKGKIDSVYYGEYGIIVKADTGELLLADTKLDESEEYLSREIINLIKDDTLRYRYATAAREKAMQYDIQSITDMWIRLISDLCRGNDFEDSRL